MAILRTIDVDFDGAPYPIKIGRGLLDGFPELLAEKTRNKQVLIVADAYFKETAVQRLTLNLEGAGFSVFTYLMDAGKGNKNINEVMKIYGIMEENNFPRDAVLVALGGGVIGDLAGFVASTWLRGMNLVHIPTSLMAMVDSSVGGKVAINFRRTINAIGNYYHPVLNLIDLDFVDSLPERDYRSGIAEVIKCALIADADFCDFLVERKDQICARNEQDVVSFISRTLEIKIDHVKGDTREGGKRLLLNYGHTLGHSIEISTERHSQELFRHGEGVAIGTMAVAYIAEKFLGLDSGLYQKIEHLFDLFELPTFVDTSKNGFDQEKLRSLCKKNVYKDKKRKDNVLRLILVDQLGKAAVYNDVPSGYIEDAFDHVIR
jgi:3-dehydroquinate synthase